MNTRVDPIFVQHEIMRLVAYHPDLADDDVLRADMIEGATSTHDFLSKLVRLIGEDKARMHGIAGYRDELAIREDRLARRVDALRSIAFSVMQTADLKKIELDTATLSIRNNPPKVIVTNEALLPDILCRIKREPDKTKIKELLTAGNHVNGAELSNAEPTLSVRTK